MNTVLYVVLAAVPASAQPPRAAANNHSASARSAPRMLAMPVTTAKPRLPAKLPTIAGPTATVLMVEYQRIGRDLMKLQQLRGTDSTLELWPRFRAIKLDEMCATPEGRVDLEAELKDLRVHIDRKRGIELSAECLNNPLAANCQ